MVDVPSSETAWTPWRVAPRSGFESSQPDGSVALVQVDAKQFQVQATFRFGDTDVEKSLIRWLERHDMDAATARAAVDDARTFSPSAENPTDLASIPRYLRWFENSYGAHTLAAIIHDDLIVGEPNRGPLRSDTLSDRFFREMLRAAGVKWLKRWIMWAAVALRSRWAAGGWRRASVVAWIALASVGMTALGWGLGSWLLGWDGPAGTGTLFAVAGALPIAAATLWGRQYGAGIVAALAAPWILPAAVVAGVGYGVYGVLEWALGGFRRD